MQSITTLYIPQTGQSFDFKKSRRFSGGFTGQMINSNEITVKKITLRRLQGYADIQNTRSQCEKCPRYNNSWSCPPYTPDITRYAGKYRFAYVIAVKVGYPKEMCGSEDERAQLVSERTEYYDMQRRRIQAMLLGLEKKYPGTYSVSTCLICERCARSEGLPCRHPDRMRYSMTTLGFDFTRLLRDEFNIELTWSGEKLSAYDYIVAALFTP